MEPTGEDRPGEAEGDMKGGRAGAACFGSSCTLNGKRITSLAAIVAPQTCDLVRDAFGVQAPTRPATSLGPFASLLSTAFAPIVLHFVLPNFRDIFFVPTANLESIQRLNRWGVDFAFNNPTVERTPTYSELLYDFDCRVSLH